VAVKEVRGRSSPTLQKAAQLARALHARVELFHAISEPIAVDALAFASESMDRYQSKQQARYLRRLEALAEPLRRTGLDVTVAAEWDFPAHEAVVRRAMQGRADLIVVERHASRHIAPWLLHYNDWELLRHSPVPVLLVKTRRKYESMKVLAAIDPSHAFAKTARLDDAILRIAHQLCATTRAQLHAMHAFVPALTDIATADLTVPDVPERIMGNAASQARARFDKTLRAARLGTLPRNRRHLVARHPVDAIPQVVKQAGIDVVVMGLVRTGFKGLFIGNTAEQLVDELPCDLMIVKPPGFATKVPAKPRGPYLISIGPPYGAV
jgi:universal stress protein E